MPLFLIAAIDHLSTFAQAAPTRTGFLAMTTRILQLAEFESFGHSNSGEETAGDHYDFIESAANHDPV